MNETTGRRPIHIPGRMACAVCGRVLDEHEGKGFTHTIDLLDADHPAVPVPDTEVEVNEKCDFCFADDTVWMLPASDFNLPPVRIQVYASVSLEIEDESLRLHSLGNWGACDPCGQLILAEQWPKVLRRVRDRWAYVHSGNPMDEDTYIGMYHLFNTLRRHVTGPLVRIDR